MTSRYIQEASTICAMATAMLPLRSLDDRAAVHMTLTQAGFSAVEISAFMERAIFSELMRRLSFADCADRGGDDACMHADNRGIN